MANLTDFDKMTKEHLLPIVRTNNPAVTLQQIKDICTQYRACEHGRCFLGEFIECETGVYAPAKWDIKKIEEAIKEKNG